jgi:hypothetical protein
MTFVSILSGFLFLNARISLSRSAGSESDGPRAGGSAASGPESRKIRKCQFCSNRMNAPGGHIPGLTLFWSELYSVLNQF